ncbi:hypothetical protein HHX47_DHR3000348 [Lentinula edodes]|nr:hypothetical protein HHX47_DHR3000348 [Lentinula edodes]
MLLPEELLEMMIEDLAYTPIYPFNSLSSARCKRVSSELITLSVVNRQLRRISLPFLFAYVTLKHLEDVEGFLQKCLVNPILGRTIRVIKLHAYFPNKDVHDDLCRLLPHLTRLASVDLQGSTSSVLLLNAVNQHPSISTMIVDSMYDLHYLPKPLSSLDLSKVVVERGSISQPGLETYYARGLKVYQLVVRQPELLKEEFGDSRFPGLHEISLAMNRHPILLEWLPRLASTHPHLKNVIFVDMSNSKRQYTSDTIPFISPFIEKSSQQGLDATFNITRLVISRTQCGSLSAMEWRVTELVMNVQSSLLLILPLVASCFSYIHTLGVGVYHKRRYNVDELVAVLASLRSLRVLKPVRLFQNLRSPDEGVHRPWKPLRHIDKIHRVQRLGARAEARLYWYMSLISKGLPSLEAVYVEEVGYGNEKSCSHGDWSLQGWLSVRAVTRDVMGTLELSGTSGTIQLNGIYFPRKTGHDVLSRVLPRFTRLVCLDLQGSTSSALLLKALYEHPSVSTILVDSPYGLYNLPEGPSCLDLSKTVLERADSSHPRLEVWLSRGLTLTKLDVHKPESLQEEFGIRTFRGLQELSLNLNLHPVTLSWLHQFTSGHPNLKLIKFIDQSTMKDYFIRHTVPFVQSFVEKAHQEQLCRAFNLTHIVVSRAHRGSLSLDWQVSELTMSVRSSLIEILSLVTLCFPTIHTLGISAEHCRKRYDIDNLIAALARFPLLRVLNLSHLFKRLRSPNEELQRPWKLFRHVDKVYRVRRLGAQAEARLYWYASLIAHGLRSIEALKKRDMVTRNLATMGTGILQDG